MNYISKPKLPKRLSKSNKGDNGKVLIIGGSVDYVGAVALAGLAALRSGVDWVTIASLEKVGWAINCLSSDLVVKKLKGTTFTKQHVTTLLNEEKKYDVVLIGNGITLKAKSFVKEYIKTTTKPLVIDADAIKVIELTNLKNSIITPHKKEFELLMKNSKIKNKVQLKKNLNNNIIIKKGKIDEIISQNSVLYNKTGNPGLTKAGTGDVLAGLVAGFYAQTKDSLNAAKLGTYYNGLIGDILLKKKKGYSYLASDMIDEIKRLG